MDISNLLFFDKKGESYNLTLNSDGYWEGSDYFLPVSTALFDNSNIFILEKVTTNGSTSYKFPEMEPGSKFEIIWKTADAKDNFFLFTIALEGDGSTAMHFIDRKESITVNYSDFDQAVGNLDLAYPFQINVAFTPAIERAYSRVMQVNYTNASGTSLVLEMTFYGEGEDEDERFRIWLENFGIRFNREDALLLKDYDLKESLVDWTKLNAARKQLLVNQDQVYPYVGTYKGMLNLISLLGYRDVLRVKEYWRDVDPGSNYYKKFAMVDVTDLMQIGDISSVNLVDEAGQFRESKKFKKTEFLALAYQFTVATDTYDDDGLPEVEATTEFTVDEIFFKLHGIAKKLETEILPLTVIIRDIIGEFIYFSKFNLRNWIDETQIESFQINDEYRIKLLSPNTSALELKIRDIRTLYPKINGTSLFPSITYNNGPIEPYENGQIYQVDEIPVLISAISDYYSDILDYDFRNGEVDTTNYGDDITTKIGCPIVLEAYIPDLTLQELDGVTFNDFIQVSPTTSSTSNSIGTGTKTFSFADADVFAVGNLVKIYVTSDLSQYMQGTVETINGTTVELDITDASGTATNNTSWTIYLIDTHHTIGRLKYRNSYDIEWIITGPQDYTFTRRGKIEDLVKIGHILPQVGDYEVLVHVHDMQGGTSMDRTRITVKSEEPVLQVFTKMQDKFKYDFKSLSNLTIADLGQSPLFDAFTNAINPDGLNQPITEIQAHYLNWYTYTNYWGIGKRINETEFFYENEGYLPYSQSNNPNKIHWGTGSVNGQPTLKDYGGVTLGELYHFDFSDSSYIGDSIDGFYIDLKSLSSSTPDSYIHSLQFGGFAAINLSTEVPAATPASLLAYLETTSLPGWADYDYALIGERIKASAKSQIKRNHSIITALHTATVYDQGNSVSYPIDESGLTISSTEISASSLYTFLEVYETPTVSDTSGLAVGARVRIANALGGYVDGVITTLTTEGLSIQAQFANQIGDFTDFDIYWLETIYTFSRPGQAFTDSSISSIQSDLAIIDRELDEDLLYLYCKFEDKIKRVDSYLPANASSIRYWIEKGYVTYDTLADDFYLNTTQIDFGISETPTYSILELAQSDNNWQHRSNDPAGWTLTQDFYIKLDDSNQAWENDKVVKLIFDSSIFAGSYSIRIVTDSLNEMGAGAYGTQIAALTKADFPEVDGIPSKLAVEIVCDNASNFQFSVTKTGPEQKGYLPSYYDQNSFTFSNIKTTYDTLPVPVHHPVFVVISNLPSNVETEWTLIDIKGNIIVNLLSPSYFVWRFSEMGEYLLKVRSKDTRNNEYYLNTSVAMTSALRPKEYQHFIEAGLNDRKRFLVNS